MQKLLINWYLENKREFPWRINNDPYRIWISEIMLQQTTTEAVIPYYNRFMNHYPTIHDLSHASLDDIYKLWEGLGYYRRAKHIYETAQILHKQYHDEFPKDYNEVLKLKGIGQYSAGAICSIAFHQETPSVDGNVLRIISRYKGIKDNIASTKTHKIIYNEVLDLIKGYDPSSFNQGLMDLGATICKPRNPKCNLCPIKEQCYSYMNHTQNVLPINIKKIKHQEINYITGIITYKDSILLIKNKQGLLENLYGLIQYDIESPYTFEKYFYEEYKNKINTISYIDRFNHTFTHRKWHMFVYHFELDKEIDGLIPIKDIDQYTISTAHLKVIKEYLKKRV